MKRMLLFLSMVFLSIALVACGGNNDSNNQSADTADNNEANETEEADENTESAEKNQSEEEKSEMTNGNEMKAKMDELDYSDFELEVDYGEDKEYEAEIEQENDQVEAELEDEINGENLNGQGAFDKIYPLVKQLTIDKDTEKEDAIADVLDVFDLDDDFEELELEITFQDGVKVEFEVKK